SSKVNSYCIMDSMRRLGARRVTWRSSVSTITQGEMQSGKRFAPTHAPRPRRRSTLRGPRPALEVVASRTRCHENRHHVGSAARWLCDVFVVEAIHLVVVPT